MPGCLSENIKTKKEASASFLITILNQLLIRQQVTSTLETARVYLLLDQSTFAVAFR